MKGKDMSTKVIRLDYFLSTLLPILLLICFCLIPLFTFSQISSIGSEGQVNSNALNIQGRPSVDMDTAGNYLVVWQSLETDGSGYGIYGQRYLANGTKNGSEFLVNTLSLNNQIAPQVAMDQSGRSVVVWMDDELDGSGWGIYGQRYDASGDMFGVQFRINSSSTAHQKFPKVAMNLDGDFVVCWTEVALNGSSFQIKARKYNFQAAQHAGLDVENASSGFQGYPDVSIDAAGNFAVVWQRADLDGSGMGISARLFDNSNTPNAIGTSFQVNTYTNGNQSEPKVAMDQNGNFIVIWTSFGQDGDADGIYGQKFLADGSPLDPEFQISQTTASFQKEPSLIATIEGGFRATWTSFDADPGLPRVYIRELKQDGSASESQLSALVNGSQLYSNISQRKNNKSLVAVWQDGTLNSTQSKDGSDFGIFSQQYSVVEDLYTIFPVELLFFEGLIAGQAIQLDWETSFEQNNAGFQVQRAEESKQDFADIAWVESKGDTDSGHTYQLLDENVSPGLSYTYRLKQIDLDGKISFSNNIKLRMSDGNKILLRLFPNPLEQGDLNIRILGDGLLSTSYLEIYDRLGRKVYEEQIEPEEVHGTIRLKLEHLSEGYYTLLLKGPKVFVSKSFKRN